MIAVIWLATVAGAATLTWTVISAAGTQVGQIPPVSPEIDGTATPTPSGSASPAPSPHRTATTDATSSTPVKPATSAPPKPPSYVGSWSGPQGKVIARCTGTAVSLVSAIPNDGYRVKTEHEGTQQLVVEFESAGESDDHDGDEAHLLVTCSQSRPVFRNH